MISILNKGLLAAVLGGFLLPTLGGQNPPQREPYKLSVEVDLVLLNVLALDRSGGAVTGLQQANFAIYEDGRLQEIALFAGQDSPATIGLVVDSSGSMAARWPEVRHSVAAFAAESNPADEMFVIHFNDATHFVLPPIKAFTNDSEELRSAITDVRPRGQTALYDAVAAGFDHLKKGHFDKKILVILSDGADNASSHKLEQLLAVARQASVTVYAIGVYEPEAKDRNPKVLKQLTSATGGEAYFPQSDRDLRETWRRIAAGIRSQYTLGYYPQRSNDGTFRKVKVVASSPAGTRILIHTRPGYFARAKDNVGK